MKAIRLQTEYLANPRGIDIQHPRLMWNCEGGLRQTAWQIVSEKWDSGKVEGSAMHADYPLALQDRERTTWKVRLWDENGQPGDWSETASFEMGIHEWKARWITGNYRVDKKKRYPVDCFRKAFTAGHAKEARLYITACGLYENRRGRAGVLFLYFFHAFFLFSFYVRKLNPVVKYFCSGTVHGSERSRERNDHGL